MTDIIVSQTADVIITADPTATTLVVTADLNSVLQVPQQGPPGVQGPQGPGGPAGPQGPAPSTAQMQAAVQPLVGQPGGIAGQDALSTEVARAEAAEAGKAPLDASSYVPLANLRIRRAQFLNALEAQASGSGQTLFDAVPANPGSTIWIAYNHEPFVEPSGTLAAFVQSTFGFSATQMTALFTAAAQVGN